MKPGDVYYIPTTSQVIMVIREPGAGPWSNVVLVPHPGGNPGELGGWQGNAVVEAVQDYGVFQYNLLDIVAKQEIVKEK